MREGGQMLASVLQFLKPQVQAGTTTKDLAELAKKELGKLGGEPAFLGYQGFPDVICTSVNDQVVHGIPTNYQLQNGDIVGLDFGVRLRGMISDGAISVTVGKLDRRVEELLAATEQALNIGIDQVKNGIHVGDIGAAIEGRLRKSNLGVVEALVGHGVGYQVHEAPEIPNVGSPGQGPILRSGETVAIEPMATLGGKEVFVDKDHWTVRTADHSLAAHFEHTVLVTEDGAEILTQV